MIRSGESPLTHPAFEGPVSGVLASMSCQLIRAGKLPPASFPVADIRLLSSVCSLVGLQVTGLGVSLGTTLEGTVVDDWLPLGVVPLSLGLYYFL